MPLVRRIPKRGFNNTLGRRRGRSSTSAIWTTLSTPARKSRSRALKAKNLAKGRYDVLKVLGDGELTKKLKISAHRFSKSALEKIEKAGGEAVVLPGKKPVVKNKQKAK